MKKIITAGLILALIAALTGCASQGSSGQSTTDTASASGYTGEQARFLIHTTANQGTVFADALDVFCDEVEAKTGGKVTFDRYYSGTLCTQAETLDYLSSGSFDIAFLGTDIFSAQIPLTGFPGTIYASESLGGSQYAVDYGNYIFLENEESSALIQAEGKANHIHYLGVIAAGTNVFVSKEQVTSLADLSGMRVGSAMNRSAYESLGMTVIEVMPNDMYDNFQRGIIDCSNMSLSAAVRLMWYEVAPYYIMDGTFGWAQTITMNNEKWEGCSPELQAILQEAALKTGAYTATQDDIEIQNYKKQLEENGAVVGTLSEDECMKWASTLLSLKLENARTLAKGKDYEADLEKVLGIALDYLNVELTD